MMRLRKAEYSDMDLLYEWANDPIVRSNSFISDSIPYDVHKDWFNRMMADSTVIQFILVDNNVPVGQIRLNLTDDEAEIGYSIASEYRGKGYGHKILRLLEDTVKQDYPDIHKLIAKVKPDNEASKQLFEKEGYNMKYLCYSLEVKRGTMDLSGIDGKKTILEVDIYERRIVR